MPYVCTTCPRDHVQTCQKRANWSFLRAKVPKACQTFNLACQRSKRCADSFNYFSKELYFLIYLIYLYLIYFILYINILFVYSNTGVFLWVLRKLLEEFILQNTTGGCFCTLRTTVLENIVRRNEKKSCQKKFSYNYVGSPTSADYNSWRSQYSYVFLFTLMLSYFSWGKFGKTLLLVA